MSNSSLAVRIFPGIEATLAFGSISSTYATIGSPLTNPAVQMVFQNLTNQTISFSWDGTNSFISLAAGTSYVCDIQANRGRGEALMAAQGTQFWVKQTTATAPTSGAAYISFLYISTGSN